LNDESTQTPEELEEENLRMRNKLEKIQYQMAEEGEKTKK